MLALIVAMVFQAPVCAAPANGAADSGTERIAWFNEAKFGLFVHWGPFSVQGNDPNAAFDYFAMKEDAKLREEFRNYADQFNPKAFDAMAWVNAAKSAGMRYLIFTSKHHDGYCMFDSALTDFDTMEGAPKQDYVGELVKAARAGGIKIGFYYSMLDWRHPDYTANIDKFVNEYLFGQVKELCTNYGPIDCLWFDGEWDYPSPVWRAPELVQMIRALQPNILINDRLGKGERGITPLADFYTREQPSEMNTTMPFEREKPYSWEACMTIGDFWQYSLKDKKFKSGPELVRILVDVVSRGGNLLLNVGPAPDGEIPKHLLDRLHYIGAWMHVNGESIYGTTRGPFKAFPAGKCTAKGNRLYIHIERSPGERLALSGLQNTIQKAWFLKTGKALSFDNTAKTILLPEVLPDEAVSTVGIELDSAPVAR
ncbi:MAG TPA: alpha-L-fucosidase [Candidatus Hydrogenedentes bacterium]|nr:alpha-L-fucosidase [Candidatus Hydrogenedentota bacterium]